MLKTIMNTFSTPSGNIAIAKIYSKCRARIIVIEADGTEVDGFFSDYNEAVSFINDEYMR